MSINQNILVKRVDSLSTDHKREIRAFLSTEPGQALLGRVLSKRYIPPGPQVGEGEPVMSFQAGRVKGTEDIISIFYDIFNS